MYNESGLFLTLEDYNNREIKKSLAPIVYLSLMLIVGIPGNFTVLIIYRHKYAESVYRTIIWSLAFTDMMFCMFGIPFNIGRLIRYYTFTETWVCKLFTSTIIFFIMFSSHLLVILSIHRFRQVCLPLSTQISTHSIKHWMLGGFCLAVFFDIPQGILQPVDQIQLTNNITGHMCAVSFQQSIFTDIYNGYLTFLFSLYSLILFILYILIGRRMYNQRNVKRDLKNKLDQAGEDVSNKITKIAITVTAVFGLSYVPLFILKLMAGIINQEELNTAGFSAIKIFERSYIINHVANPFIYAYFDNRFRTELKRLFTKRRQMQPITVTSATDRTASDDKTLESKLR